MELLEEVLHKQTEDTTGGEAWEPGKRLTQERGRQSPQPLRPARGLARGQLGVARRIAWKSSGRQRALEGRFPENEIQTSSEIMREVLGFSRAVWV